MEMGKIIRLEDPYTKVKITITMPYPAGPDAGSPDHERRVERDMLNTAHCMIFDHYHQIMLPDMGNAVNLNPPTDKYCECIDCMQEITDRNGDPVEADRTVPKNYKE